MNVDHGMWAAILGVVGILFAGILYISIKRQSPGSPQMAELADTIHRGAMVFLKREYAVLIPFIIVVFFLLMWKIGVYTAIAFLAGACCSILAGFFGMNAATRANVRTTEAARASGQSKALQIAFSGGAVMGMSVGSLGLLGLGVFYYIFYSPDPAVLERLQALTGFSMGASSITPSRPTSAPTWWGKWKREFLKTTLVTRPLLPITSAITLATWPVWAPTCSNRMSVPSSRRLCWVSTSFTAVWE